MPLQHGIREVKDGYIIKCFSCQHEWTIKRGNESEHIVGSTRTYTGEEELFECPECEQSATVH